MRIAVLGTGVVGKTIAERLAGLGHEVVIGTRNPDATVGTTEISLKSLAEAAAGAELILNATNGAGTLEALCLAGADNLAGKVLVDVANPLDFSQGMPPTLSVVNTDSLAEQIQREFPAARVVKTLNTTNASIMVNPKGVAGGDHTMFLCGNDAEAKATVRSILESFGWSDILDLGDISAARGAEMILPIWLRIMGALDTASFNFKVTR